MSPPFRDLAQHLKRAAQRAQAAARRQAGRPAEPQLSLWTAIKVATVAEIAILGAAAAFLALAGWFSAWLDLFAQWTALWFLLSAIAAVAAWLAVERGRLRAQILLIASAGVVFSVTLMAPDFGRAALDALGGRAKAAPVLKILTFNVWDDNVNPQKTADLMLATDADLIALQEVWGLSKPQFNRIWAIYPYRTQLKPGCEAVIFSKRPLTASDTDVVMVGDHPTCFVWARSSAADGRPVTLMTTHYAWPVPPGAQATQREILAARVRAFDLNELIVTGDFNLTPWSQAMRSQDAALAPLQRRTHALFSWPANIAVLGVPAPFPLLAIDHIYAGAAWRTVKVQRLARGGSDHYGVLASLAHDAR